MNNDFPHRSELYAYLEMLVLEVKREFVRKYPDKVFTGEEAHLTQTGNTEFKVILYYVADEDAVDERGNKKYEKFYMRMLECDATHAIIDSFDNRFIYLPRKDV